MAYIPYDPYNTGIGTPDLGNINMGQVPVNNMQMAEAINYGVLPQAKEKFQPDFGGMLDATKNLKSGYTGTTRGDFVNALESGAFGPGSQQMFDRNVKDLFEGVDLGKKGTFSWGDVSPQFIGTTDKTFRGNIDIDKGALSEEALKSLPEGFFKSVGDQTFLDDDFSDIEGQTAMLGIPQGLKLGAMLKGYLKNRIKYGAASTAANLALEAKAKAAAKAKADEAAAARRQQTIAARGTAQGSGGTFVDKKTGAMKGYEKGAGGGKDAPSQHFYIARGGLAQRAPRYANGGLINFYRYGGFV